MKKEEEFYKKAVSFRDYIENTIITIDEIENLITKLMDLYVSVINLEDRIPTETKYEDVPRVTVRLGKDIKNRYWEVFDPYKKEAPVGPTIKDDLDDIVHDLNKGIWEYENDSVDNAVFTWKEFHAFHWGNHVVDLLRALHAIRLSHYYD